MLSKFVSKVPQGQLNQGNAKLGQVSQNVNAKLSKLTNNASPSIQGQFNQGNAKLGQVSQNVNAKLSKLTNNASPPTQAQQSQENPQLGRRPQNVFCKSLLEKRYRIDLYLTANIIQTAFVSSG